MIGQNMPQTSNPIIINCWLLGATTSGNHGQTVMHTPLYTPMHNLIC